jgi:hypothetical protein
LRLTYPGSGTLPSFLIAVFRDAKGADAGSFALKPLEKAGTSFTFEGQLKAPAWPGRFRLEIDMVSPSEGPSAGSPARTPGERSATTITVADVEVTRR